MSFIANLINAFKFKQLVDIIFPEYCKENFINVRGITTIDKLSSNKDPQVLLYKTLYSPEPIQRLPLSELSPKHWKFEKEAPGLALETSKVFIAILRGAKVVTSKGAVVTKDNFLLADVSKEIGREINDHKLLVTLIHKPPIKMRGLTVVVAAPDAENNYFHWMLDVIPRIGWVLDSEIEAKASKTWLINSRKLRFQDETLNLLGITNDRTIQLCENDHVVCDELIIPSMSGLSGNVSSRVVKMLRTLFSNWMKDENTGYERIYISRKNSSKRLLLNEQELEAILAKNRVSVITLENLKVVDQIKLFFNAKFIIGVHGAGFTNLLFCKAGTKVVEIFNPNYVNQCYWTISSHVGIEYHYFLGLGEVTINYKNHLQDGDVLLDINSFDSFIGSLINC